MDMLAGLDDRGREFAVDALFTVMLSAMIADAVAIPFLGDKPFLSGLPANITLQHPRNYLLVSVLAVIAALMGLAFKNVLYKVEDWCNALWKGRPEWARPVVLGLAFGLLLLALPQMYGVGYPVMFKATAGNYAVWFLVVLAFGKVFATSVSMGIGGSGGIFAPSLFIGVTTGMAYGGVVDHLFGAGAGQPALYAVVAMGAVFTSAVRAPLTSLTSVLEMTGDFSLALPVMLAVATATTVSRALSYGTIYTTKLLRRGTDIDQAAPWRALQDLKITDIMRPFTPELPVPPDSTDLAASDGSHVGNVGTPKPADVAGPVILRHDAQALFASESFSQALRQLEVYGLDGLPVLSPDGHRVQGWVTSASLLRALARKIHGAHSEATQAQAYADQDHRDTQDMLAHPPVPLPGYQVIEITITDNSPAAGRKLADVSWPPASIPVSLLRGRQLQPPHPGSDLAPGDRVSLLIPAPHTSPPPHADGTSHQEPAGPGRSTR